MSSNYNQLPSFDSADLTDLKEKLVSASHILDNEGITDGFGHVSARIPNQQAFITLAGVSPGCSTATISAVRKRRRTNGRFMPVSCALAPMS